MKEYSQQLSSLIDNEFDDKKIINDILDDVALQQQFSRYQLIGDVMRDDCEHSDLRIDITDKVMDAIANEGAIVSEKKENNVLSFLSKVKSMKNNDQSLMKRFGQYAVAASVAGVVVVSSLMINQNAATDPNAAPVLNTVPFAGAAAPVSLQVTPSNTENVIKEQNERLEALLKDHQLQLQMQP